METCPNRPICLEAVTWEEESKWVCLGQEGQANTNIHISRSVFLPSRCNPYKSRREPATHPHTRATWPTSFGDAAIFPLMPLWLKHLGAGSLSGIHLYTGFQCMEPCLWSSVILQGPSVFMCQALIPVLIRSLGLCPTPLHLWFLVLYFPVRKANYFNANLLASLSLGCFHVGTSWATKFHIPSVPISPFPKYMLRVDKLWRLGRWPQGASSLLSVSSRLSVDSATCQHAHQCSC